MFKNLKKKLEQGVAQSKAVVSGLTMGDDSIEKSSSSESLGKPLAESTPHKDVRSSAVTTVQRSKGGPRVPTGQLVDIPLSEETDSTQYETASERSSVQGDETPKGQRSRTSSISSMTSDNSYFPSVSFSHSYYVPSDAESEIEETSVNLSSVSKEDLYAFVKRFERRAFKYKSKFMELAAAYKDIIQEREKLKLTMAQCQDRAFRRMSELREQIQLDQLAKRDLEENFRLLLDEKDEYMKVLQMQVKLLKDGKEIPEELQAKLISKQAKAEAAPPIASSNSKGNISTNEEIELLKSKIKRQDGLLQKCKETISSYKERVSQLSLDKQELIGKLELNSKADDKTDSQSSNHTTKLQSQIQEARKIIEQLESDREVAVAEVKKQVHEEIIKKDAELEQIKGDHQKLIAENSGLKLEIDKLANEVQDLRRTNQEQLEKARSIMKQLKDDKQLALEQAEARIKQAEQSMEEEKEKMINDLKRGKAEALSVIQQELEKNLIIKVQQAVEERDKYWNIKMAAQEENQNEIIKSKDKEKELALAMMQEEISLKLKEQEAEISAAFEEREMQKMTDLTGQDEQKDSLLQHIEELKSENIELNNKLAKLQETLEDQVSEFREKLKVQELEHSRLLEELKSNYETSLIDERKSLSEKASEEMKLLKESHTQEMHAILEKQEQSFQESNSQTENYYKTEMENVKQNLENLVAVTKDQLEEVRINYNEVQTKLIETEQLLTTVQCELDSRKKEQESQIEELYAAINGKGEENESLKRCLEEIQSQLGDKEKELEETVRKFTQTQEEAFRLREQVEATQGESTTKMEELFLEREDLIQQNQLLTAKERTTDNHIKTLEESNLELRNESQILFEELKSVKEELTVLQHKLKTLHMEKCSIEEEFQQMLTLSEQEREKSNSQAVQILEEQVKLLNEEHDCLCKSAESSKYKVAELERHLEVVTQERELTESKTKEFESQVNHLQEIIKNLESNKSNLEMEKVSLEEKLSELEEIIVDVKASKEELNEKLLVQHETLIQQSAVDQQMQELRNSDLSSQIDTLNEQVQSLQKALSSKNDEKIVLKTRIDESDSVVQSLETKIQQLTAELESSIQESDSNKAVLAQNLVRFEELKNETDAKLKKLEDIIDSLTVKLNQKQLECEEMKNNFILEKDSLIKNYDEQMDKVAEEIKVLEQTSRDQCEEKQIEFKEMITKMKADYETRLQEKDFEFENHIKEMMSQKDVGIEDLTKNLERLKEEQLRNQEQKYQAAVEETVTEWQVKYEALNDEYGQTLEAVRSQNQQQIHDLQQKLDSLAEKLSSLKNSFVSVQAELEGSKIQMETMSEEHRADIEKLNIEFTKKDAQLHELMANVESLHKQLREEAQQNENLTSQVHNLTEQLQDKDVTLESMTGRMSIEQEHLHKQLTHHIEIAEELQVQKHRLSEELEATVEKYRVELQEKESIKTKIDSLTEQLLEKDNKLESVICTMSTDQEHLLKQLTQQMEIAEELQAQKDSLLSQLEEAAEKHKAELQEKLTVLNDVSQKLQLLELEHASIEEMLRINDTSNDQGVGEGSLREHIEQLMSKKDILIRSLESDTESKVKSITALQMELQSVKDYNDQMLADLQQNHSKEVDILKSHYESQIMHLSSSDAEMQSKTHKLESQLKDTNEKLQECIENYETKLEEERSKLERREASLKEQMNVLKQQLHEIQSQAEVSSNELQSSLQQRVKEGEDKLLTQMQSHQDEIEAVKQETEQKMKDLKQKYIVKLKEFQSQSKKTSEELEKNLQSEKSAKEEINAELNRASAHIQQLEENSENSKHTIVGLEVKIAEMAAQIEAKDNELIKLKTDMTEGEKNIKLVLQETQNNYLQMKDTLTETESKLKEKESNLHKLNEQLHETQLILDQTNSEIIVLKNRIHELKEAEIEEKEKHELEVQEKNNKCFKLEDDLEKLQKLLNETQGTHVELEDRVKSVSAELETVQAVKQHLQAELSQLSAENKELHSKLLDAEALLASSSEVQASVVKELDNRLVEEISQREQILQESETKLREIQNTCSAELAESKSVNVQIKQEYEARLDELQQAHKSELAELSTNIEAQSNSKVAEYKRKAEAFISQMKKQLHDEKTALFDVQQEKIARLEETIAAMTSEIDDLKQSKEIIFAENDKIIQNLKSEIVVEVQSKQSVVEEYYLKEKEFQESESNLKGQMDLLLSENNVLLEKLCLAEKEGKELKLHYVSEIEKLKSNNDHLQRELDSVKSDKAEEIIAVEKTLEETMQRLQKEHHAALEEQANEHTSKLKMLLKEMNSQIATKERDFENIFREVLDKSERGEQQLMRERQDDINELRKEIFERDERIEELHMEFKAKIQAVVNEKDQQLKELQSELVSARHDHQQEHSSLQSMHDQSNGSSSQMKKVMLQNQTALTTSQGEQSESDFHLQQQVVLLTRQIEQMKEKHRLELAEANNKQAIEPNSLPKPFVPTPARQILDSSDPHFSLEMQDLELHNIDLQAQVSYLSGELGHCKAKERDLLKKVEKFERAGKGISEDDDQTASIDGLYLNHADSAIFREPTEFEYLRNILYEYMMGREPKTLAKVIATVVRFSDEQTRNVLARSDTHLT